MSEEILNYYRKQGEISNPGKYAKDFDNLPYSIEELCRVVQNIISHIFWIQKVENYGFVPKDVVEKGRDPSKELNLRTVEEKLEALYSFDDTCITEQRDNINRVIGNCRDFALFLVSMLRHKGIPARVRSGAAKYFYPDDPNKFEDHYICEYWKEDEERWVMVDPQLDELQRKTLQLEINVNDIPQELFLGAGRTWKVFRTGEFEPERFGIFEWRGEMFVFNKLIMDLASLNKVEVLAWESWGICSKVTNIKKMGYPIFDELADKISQVNNPEVFYELKELFEKDSRYCVPDDYEPWFMKFEY
jgi:hypothetical protein